LDDFSKYLNDLPVIPDVALKIISFAEDNIDISFNDLEELIRIDTAITSKILKVANSAMYARQNQIKSLQKAISLLGFKTIKSLVLIISATSAFKPEGNQPFFKDFWTNSVLTAFYAKELAAILFDSDTAEDVFLAGLIHKIGQVALYRHNKEYYRYIKTESDLLNITDIEEFYFKVNHKELGSKILKTWSFPELLVDCAREYGSNNVVSRYKKEIILVSLGEIMANEESYNTELFSNIPFENSWFKFLGMTEDYFLSIKKDIIQTVKNSDDFKDCKNLF